MSITIEVTHPAHVLMSSDFSQQEPKLSAFVSGDRTLVEAFKAGRDAYATLASIALGYPYEECLEFNPVTKQVNPEGKARRSVGKVLNLGVTYGMSEQSIAESLYADRKDMTEKEKLQEGKKIRDALMKGFPDLAKAIAKAELFAAKTGYTETILGRRRHHPDMTLPKYQFEAEVGYVNPDVDPLDPESLKQNQDKIPQRILDALNKEFNSNGKYDYGKVVRRTKELAEQHIKVINNSFKIDSARRQVFNAIIQGSAAELTKMAILKLENDPEWIEIGGRLLVPVHDELIVEVPIENMEKGAEILARDMCAAGDFLPFSLTCDVETTFRWYGLFVEDVLSFDKPDSMNWDDMTESNIKWIQCMLFENEYILPVFKGPDGKKPEGAAAKGINGTVTDELKTAVQDYKNRYSLKSDSEFIDHIEKKVIRGIV